jgi:hypothetical protein
MVSITTAPVAKTTKPVPQSLIERHRSQLMTMIDDVRIEINNGKTDLWEYASEGLYRSFETLSIVSYRKNATNIPYLTELRKELVTVDALMSSANPKDKRHVI